MKNIPNHIAKQLESARKQIADSKRATIEEIETKNRINIPANSKIIKK